jgi:hypothetical protein
MDRGCRASEVVYLVYLKEARLDYVVTDYLEGRVVRQVGDVLFPAREKVIEADDFVPVLEKLFA